MNRSLLVLVTVFLLASASGMTLQASAQGVTSGEYDKYGGWYGLKGKKTGFFHTQQINGRWWLVTPEGNVFISKGVAGVYFGEEEPGPLTSSPAPPGWTRNAARQLRGWGFNTVGAWSDREMFTTEMAYTLILDAAESARRQPFANADVPDYFPVPGYFPDYFSKEFRESTDSRAAKLCAPRANDPWLLGYFTDNEQSWGSIKISWDSWNGIPPSVLQQSLLENYLKFPPTSPGYQKAVEYLKSRGTVKGAITEDDMDGFEELAAAEYARVCREAIRRYDPSHLILGCRYPQYAPDPVVRGMCPFFDVISMNDYHPRPPVWKLEHLAQLTGKPFMLTEFSFKAMDSGLPNTKGAADPVATQQDRADNFSHYVQELVAMPSCVGFHWFEYRDEPAEGRQGDGENSNYGLVKKDGTAWEVLTSRMREVNASLENVATRK